MASKTGTRSGARTRGRATSVAQIVEVLRGRIARQDVPPGAKLRETDLA